MRSTSSDSFSSDMIALNVIHNGALFHINELKSKLTVEHIVALAIQHFYESTEKSDEFKLISVSGRYILKTDLLVTQSDLKNNDELLLLRRRPPPEKENLNEDKLRGPTYEHILEETKHIEEKNSNRPEPPVCSADFKNEMRKIFISLSQASATVLSTSPKVGEIISMLRDHFEVEPEPQAVRHLMAMGFSEAACILALRRNRMNKTEALDWLLEHNNTVQDTAEQLGESSSSKAKDLLGKSKSRDKKMSTLQPNLIEYVTSLLETFRLFKQRDFKPNAVALQSLLEMGFEDQDAVKEALLITGNDQSAACEWMLGARRPSLQDLDTGLDVQCPIFKSIIKNPEVQLSLLNPRMLLCMLTMIENASWISKWLVDQDTSPIIHQLFRLYHAEKHL